MKKIALLFLISISIAHANEDYLSIARSAQESAKEKTVPYMQDAIDVNKNIPALTTIYKKDALLAKEKAVDNIKNYYQLNSQVKNGSNGTVLIFVSFSMPKSSIEAYMRDAKIINAKIIIRGLISNSFQETFKVSQDLIKSSGGTGFDLNPPAFKRFSISSVPAIVVMPADSDCLNKEICDKEKDFDIIKGDITLEEGLKKISDRGIASSVAGRNLKILQGDQ